MTMNEEHIIEFNRKDIKTLKFQFKKYIYYKAKDNYYTTYIFYNSIHVWKDKYKNHNILNDKYFDLNLMLYKLHTKKYFCRYNHGCKELL